MPILAVRRFTPQGFVLSLSPYVFSSLSFFYFLLTTKLFVNLFKRSTIGWKGLNLFQNRFQLKLPRLVSAALRLQDLRRVIFPLRVFFTKFFSYFLLASKLLVNFLSVLQLGEKGYFNRKNVLNFVYCFYGSLTRSFAVWPMWSLCGCVITRTASSTSSSSL